MMNKDIAPVNKDGQAHGYWEIYYFYDGTICYKGYYDNGEVVGYWEDYFWVKEIMIYI